MPGRSLKNKQMEKEALIKKLKDKKEKLEEQLEESEMILSALDEQTTLE